MDTVKILQELRIEFRRSGEHHHVTNNFIGIDCPFCSPGSHKFKLGIGRNCYTCTCWSCGKRSLVDALVESSSQPWQTVRKLLGEFTDNAPVEVRPAGKLVIPEGVGPLLPAHREYLRERGFRPKTLRLLWGVQGIGIAPKYSWRLWIPIHAGGKVVSWTTRGLADHGQRYVTAPKECEAVSSKSVVFGADLARHGVIICEGPFDAMRIGPGGVATLGTAFTQAQVERLSRFPVRAIVFDSEPEAQRQATRLADALAVHPGRTVRVELDAADPGSAGPKEIRRLREEFLE
jgi:hypothetical protein